MQPGNLGIVQDWWDSFPFLLVTILQNISQFLFSDFCFPHGNLSFVSHFLTRFSTSPSFPSYQLLGHNFPLQAIISHNPQVSISRFNMATVPMSNSLRPLFWLQLTTSTGCTKTMDEHWLTETGERALSKWKLCGKRQGNPTVLSPSWKWEAVVIWLSDNRNTELRPTNARERLIRSS